jgi:hypothetical protein
MRNGTSEYLRKRKFAVHARTIAEANGLRARTRPLGSAPARVRARLPARHQRSLSRLRMWRFSRAIGLGDEAVVQTIPIDAVRWGQLRSRALLGSGGRAAIQL